MVKHGLRHIQLYLTALTGHVWSPLTRLHCHSVGQILILLLFLNERLLYVVYTPSDKSGMAQTPSMVDGILTTDHTDRGAITCAVESLDGDERQKANSHHAVQEHVHPIDMQHSARRQTVPLAGSHTAIVLQH